MMKIFIDIETLPTNDGSMIAELRASITAPGQYKKPESIADWMKENLDQATAEKISKTSFDGLYGRIACIAWAFDNDEIQSTIATDSECDALNRLYDSLREFVKISYVGGSFSSPVVIVGHNIAGFDLPFMKHRSIINSIRPQPDILKAMNAKPWDDCISDTMLMWSQDREKRVSLDKLCMAFGIPGKDGFDGSMVAETWNIDPQKVIDYCKADVQKTRDVYRRLTWSS